MANKGNHVDLMVELVHCRENLLDLFILQIFNCALQSPLERNGDDPLARFEPVRMVGLPHNGRMHADGGEPYIASRCAIVALAFQVSQERDDL